MHQASSSKTRAKSSSNAPSRSWPPSQPRQPAPPMSNNHRDNNATHNMSMQHTVQNAEEYCFVKYRRTAFFGDLDHLRLHRIGMPEIESLTMPDVEKVTVLQLRAYLNLYEAALEGTRRRPKSRNEVDTFYEQWLRFRDLTHNQTRPPPPPSRRQPPPSVESQPPPTSSLPPPPPPPPPPPLHSRPPRSRSRKRPPPLQLQKSPPPRQRRPPRPPSARPPPAQPMQLRPPPVRPTQVRAPSARVRPPRLAPIISPSAHAEPNATYGFKLAPLTSPITPASPLPLQRQTKFDIESVKRRGERAVDSSAVGYYTGPKWPMHKSPAVRTAMLTTRMGNAGERKPLSPIQPSSSVWARETGNGHSVAVVTSVSESLPSSRSLIAAIDAPDSEQQQKKQQRQYSERKIQKRKLILWRAQPRISLETYANRLHTNRLRRRHEAAVAAAAASAATAKSSDGAGTGPSNAYSQLQHGGVDNKGDDAEDEADGIVVLEAMTASAILDSGSAVAELAARPRYVAPDMAAVRNGEMRERWQIDSKHGIGVKLPPLRLSK